MVARARKSPSEMFEEEAARWEETGKIDPKLLNEYGVAVLRLWIKSDGAKVDKVSRRLKRYHKAMEKQIEEKLGPNWYYSFLRLRGCCSVCGKGFRAENLGLCTHCDALIGYCHQFAGGAAPNGNEKCPKCRMGEIVG
jgi:hypothetical protein